MRLLLVFLLITIPAQAVETDWIPKPDQVAQLEKKLVLPAGARQLKDYARYYWGTTENGVKGIRGALVLGKRTGTYISRPPLLALDGGCNQVIVFYDLSKDKVSSRCSGVA